MLFARGKGVGKYRFTMVGVKMKMLIPNDMYVKEYFSNTSHTYKYLKRLPTPQGCSTNSGLRAILQLSEVVKSTTLT